MAKWHQILDWGRLPSKRGTIFHKLETISPREVASLETPAAAGQGTECPESRRQQPSRTGLRHGQKIRLAGS